MVSLKRALVDNGLTFVAGGSIFEVLNNQPQFTIMRTIKVQSAQTLPYGKFTKGDNIVTGSEQKIGYWTGRNDIRHDGKSNYLCIAGTDTKRGQTKFVERVYKIDSKTFEENRQWLINNIDDLIEHDGVIARYSEVMGFVDNE